MTQRAAESRKQKLNDWAVQALRVEADRVLNGTKDPVIELLRTIEDASQATYEVCREQLTILKKHRD